MQKREFVLELAEIGVVRFGSFRLKSGLESPFYLDLRRAVSRPHLCRAMAELVMACTANVEFDAVVGIPYTAAPIATHVSAMSGKPLLLLRKERKGYGGGGSVVGDFDTGMRCLVVDDLITTGSSKLETVAALEAEGLRAEHIAVIIDRSGGVAGELAAHGLSLHAAVTLPEILDILLQDERISRSQAATVEQFTAMLTATQSLEPPVRGAADASGDTTASAPADRILETIRRKKSNLVLSLDVSDQQRFFEILDACAASLCMVKTHIDIMDGDLEPFIRRLRRTASAADLMLFEDRKFADIGSTVYKQFHGGPARIADWADLVTVHMIAGESILDGLFTGQTDTRAAHGALLLARMSSRENLIDERYTTRVMQIGARRQSQVAGYIGHAADLQSLRALKACVPSRQLLFVPGVHLSARGDGLGQQYLDVDTAVRGGADAIIVGRGIYQSDDPAAAAESYRNAAWTALQQRQKEEV